MATAISSADHIRDLALSQMENYRRQPAELISHFNRELSALDGYRGRQLLELLQNADDAGVGAVTGCRLRIDLSRGRLLVANTGRPFDSKGLTSLVISDCSPKQLDRNRFIGCKGLGFRSILAWTDRPLISSGPYDVVFDHSRAIGVVRDLAAQDAAVGDTVTEFREADGRWPIAVMRFPSTPEAGDPSLREARDWRARGFDTVILIPLREGERGDETHHEIREQLSWLPASALLFCRYLTEVTITGDHEAKWELDRKGGGFDPSTITLLHDGVGEEWQVYRHTGRVSPSAAATSGGARSEYEVAVAVPKKADADPDNALCVFFPTLKERLERYLPSLTSTQAGEVVGRLLTAGQLKSVGAGGLLIGTDGHLIQGCSCFFNPVEKLPPLPGWAGGIRFIDAEFQAGLQVGSKSSALRHLAADLSRCDAEAEEYRFDTVARALIDEAERGLAEEDPFRLERWKQLLRWLFDASRGARQVLPSLPIKIVTVGGALRRATTCYLGPAYPRGEVVWRLYRQFDQDEFVGPPDTCGLAGVPHDEAGEFLVSVGVNASPRPEKFQSGTEYHQFRHMVVATMDFPRTVRDRLCNSSQELEKWCPGYDIDGLLLPDRWFKLLTEGDSTAIAAFLLSSGSALLSRDTDLQAKFKARVKRELKYWYDSSIPIPNPILHYLRESAWVAATDGKRHRPSEIMLSGHGVRVLQGVYTQHAIGVRDPLITAHGGRDALDGLLTRLGAVRSLESLSAPSLYDLLLSLPERDPSGEVAPGIYRTLIESSVSVEDCPQRESFLHAGRMWARYKGEEAYLSVAQLRYNANLTITNAIEAHIPLVAIPTRMNTSLIRQLFGIPSLTSQEISLELRPEGTEYDPGSEDANLHLHIALPYIYALRLDRNLDEQGRELSLLRKAVLRVCSRARVAAILPGGRAEDIILTQPGERIVVESTLVMVGEYSENSPCSLTFWLGVAELVAELLGRELADQVGGVLRCRTPAEMLEVVQVRLGDDATAKLDEATTRFSDLLSDLEDSGDHPMPAPKPDAQDPGSLLPAKPPDEGGAGESGLSGGDNKPTLPEPGKSTFKQIEGPGDKRPRRKLVVGGPLIGSGGGRGLLASEAITFKVVEAFEQAEGRFVIRVSHLRGADSFGCDLLSVSSVDVREKAIKEQSINEADILRHIEVKGRSSRTGEVELTDNECLAAKRVGAGYWLYRVYVDPNRQGHYEVALLNNPLKSGAVRLVPRFNLAEGSGATWFTMMETVENHAADELDPQEERRGTK